MEISQNFVAFSEYMNFKQDFFSFQHLAEMENLLQSIQSTLLNKEKFFEEKYSPKLNNLYLVS